MIYVHCQKMDYIYSENVAYAHVLGEKALMQNQGCGESFFVTNNCPVDSSEFCYKLRKYCHQVGITFEYLPFPKSLLTLCAYFSYTLHWLFRGRISIGELDTLRPTILDQVNASFIVNDNKAKQILSYEPIYTLEEGIIKGVNQYMKYQMFEFVKTQRKKFG